MIGVDMGDGTILVVRDRLLTGSEPPLTTYELAIGRLTAQLAEANASAEAWQDNCHLMERELERERDRHAETIGRLAEANKNIEVLSQNIGVCGILQAQLAERDAEIKDLRQIITTYSDQEGENAYLREEMKRLSSAIGLREYTNHIRKQAVQEIYNSLQKCFWAVDFETVSANLKHKFGLEG